MVSLQIICVWWFILTAKVWYRNLEHTWDVLCQCKICETVDDFCVRSMWL